jgi:hypothetical protein
LQKQSYIVNIVPNSTFRSSLAALEFELRALCLLGKRSTM